MRVALRRIDKWWCFAGGETVIHIHPFMLWEYPSASFLCDQPSAIHPPHIYWGIYVAAGRPSPSSTFVHC